LVLNTNKMRQLFLGTVNCWIINREWKIGPYCSEFGVGSLGFALGWWRAIASLRSGTKNHWEVTAKALIFSNLIRRSSPDFDV
jgi:hypothetical protein